MPEWSKEFRASNCKPSTHHAEQDISSTSRKFRQGRSLRPGKMAKGSVSGRTILQLVAKGVPHQLQFDAKIVSVSAKEKSENRRHRNRSRRSSTERGAPGQDNLETLTDQQDFVCSMKIITHTRINAYIGKFCIRAFRGLYNIRSANSLPRNRKRYWSMPLYLRTLITVADSFLVYLNINLIV